MNKEATITITLEEYEELLIIKGKYEELKSNLSNLVDKQIISLDYKPISKPYKVTCRVGNSNE